MVLSLSTSFMPHVGELLAFLEYVFTADITIDKRSKR